MFYHPYNWTDREFFMRYEYLIYRDEAFTLIEVMIALVILSIGLIALAGLQVSAIKGNNFSKRMTTAVSIADERIEQIKNTPYANIQSEPATNLTVSNDKHTFMNFTREVIVTTNNPLPNTKRIDLTVRWVDGAKSYSVPISTIISQ
jgi:type IV pilus assembly protein PilV